MSLTLEIEDDFPPIFLSFVTTSSPLFESVYYLNNICNVNFKKHKEPFTLKRNKASFNFDFYSYKDENMQNEWWFLNNINYKKTKGTSLFSNDATIETRNFLFKSMKLSQGVFIYFQKDISIPNFQDFAGLTNIQSINQTDYNQLKKHEQFIIQDIYYDKQN